MAGHRVEFEEVLGTPEPLGDVPGKGVLGGFAFWASGDVIGLIEDEGRLHLKVDDESVLDDREAGCEPFQPHMAGAGR